MQRNSASRLCRFGVLLAGSLLIGTAVASNYDGTLDPSLNPPYGAPIDGGIPGLFDYGIDLGGASPYTNNDYVAATAVQVDGKIVAVGHSWSHLFVDAYSGVVSRFNIDGSLDSSFGDGGQIVVYFMGNFVNVYLYAVALQGDGKIVVAGNIVDASNKEVALIARFNANGDYDLSFGTNGFVSMNPNTAFASLLIDSNGQIYAAGHYFMPNHTDDDFYLVVFDNDGNVSHIRDDHFDLGANENDRAYAQVLRHVPGACVGQQCFMGYTELYLVGTADNTGYSDLDNHDCAIVAYRRPITSSVFNLDTSFGSGGHKSIDFPMAPSNEGDNICRAAIARPGGGVIIGGENYFISTLGGGTPGLASNYVLAEVDASGNVTRHDALAYFQDMAFPGIFNGIFGMAHEPNGKLVVAGHAGTDTSNHQPSDIGVIRFNPDFSFDSTFGNSGQGRAILSLDVATGQREWATALALDNHGRIVVVGERSWNNGASGDYDWLVGRLNTYDEIFRDSYDGVVPTVD